METTDQEQMWDQDSLEAPPAQIPEAINLEQREILEITNLEDQDQKEGLHQGGPKYLEALQILEPIF